MIKFTPDDKIIEHLRNNGYIMPDDVQSVYWFLEMRGHPETLTLVWVAEELIEPFLYTHTFIGSGSSNIPIMEFNPIQNDIGITL